MVNIIISLIIIVIATHLMTPAVGAQGVAQQAVLSPPFSSSKPKCPTTPAVIRSETSDYFYQPKNDFICRTSSKGQWCSYVPINRSSRNLKRDMDQILTGDSSKFLKGDAWITFDQTKVALFNVVQEELDKMKCLLLNLDELATNRPTLGIDLKLEIYSVSKKRHESINVGFEGILEASNASQDPVATLVSAAASLNGMYSIGQLANRIKIKLDLQRYYNRASLIETRVIPVRHLERFSRESNSDVFRDSNVGVDIRSTGLSFSGVVEVLGGKRPIIALKHVNFRLSQLTDDETNKTLVDSSEARLNEIRLYPDVPKILLKQTFVSVQDDDGGILFLNFSTDKQSEKKQLIVLISASPRFEENIEEPIFQPGQDTIEPMLNAKEAPLNVTTTAEGRTNKTTHLSESLKYFENPVALNSVQQKEFPHFHESAAVLGNKDSLVNFLKSIKISIIRTKSFSFFQRLKVRFDPKLVTDNIKNLIFDVQLEGDAIANELQSSTLPMEHLITAGYDVPNLILEQGTDKDTDTLEWRLTIKLKNKIKLNSHWLNNNYGTGMIYEILYLPLSETVIINDLEPLD